MREFQHWLKIAKTSYLLTQTKTRNSRGACLKHSETKSKSFTRGRQTTRGISVCSVFTRVFAIVWVSVRSSVHLSVTFVDCIKMVQARITKFSLWAAPRSLVYSDKISCHWVQGFPSNESVEEGYPPLKRRLFAVVGSNNLKTVADRYIHAAYHNKHW